MISVIIPVYNVKKYLSEAVDSVIHQSYSDLEIILVDDGSSDGSGELCDIYAQKDQRIIVIHQENKGLSGARNTGLDIAKGDFIAFLDSDDAYCPDMLRKMHEAAQQYGADLVECNFGIYHTNHRMHAGTITFHSREIKAKEGIYSKKQALVLSMEGKIYSDAWNKLYRKKLWKTLRYPEGHLHEDVCVLRPLLNMAESVYILNEPLYMHRIRPGSISTIYTMKHIQDLADAYQYSLDFAVQNTPSLITEEYYQRINQIYCRTLLARYARLAMTKQANKAEIMDRIRKEISAAREKLSTQECSPEIKGATFLYDRTPPVVFALISRTYYSLRILALKVFPQ